MFTWDESSTYIHNPPFFKTMTKELPYIEKIENAHALCFFGDSITTDHISPASYISKISCAARFLLKKGITDQGLQQLWNEARKRRDYGKRHFCKY